MSMTSHLGIQMKLKLQRLPAEQHPERTKQTPSGSQSPHTGTPDSRISTLSDSNWIGTEKWLGAFVLLVLRMSSTYIT
jgi:hypothetical protein